MLVVYSLDVRCGGHDKKGCKARKADFIGWEEEEFRERTFLFMVTTHRGFVKQKLAI